MTSARRPVGQAFPARWNSLWRGTGHARRGLTSLLWAAVRWLLAGWLWGTATRLAHFPPPLKTVGAVLAVLSLIVFLWGLWAIAQGLRHLGLGKFAITLLVLYALLVTFNILTVPDSRPAQERILPQILATSEKTWSVLKRLAASAASASDDFLFAYTGSGVLPAPPPGFPTPDPAVTPPRVVVQPAARSSAPTVLTAGGYARVANPEGQRVSARTGPGSGYEITAYLSVGERLLILEGPKSYGEQQWWKVHGAQGEGWCAEQWLKPSE